MNKFLLHPKITLIAMLAQVGTGITSFVSLLQAIADKGQTALTGLFGEKYGPMILGALVLLTIILGQVAGAGRSVVSNVDNPQAKP